MLADVMNRDFVARHVDALRDHVEEHGEELTQQIAADRGLDEGDVRKALEQLRTAPPSAEVAGQRGPAGAHPLLDERSFLSRDPLSSIVQSAIEESIASHKPELVQAGAPGAAVGAAPTAMVGPAKCLDLGAFQPDDPRWLTVIAGAVADRLVDGTHSFNTVPAEYEIAHDAVVLLVGDWGTGLERALAVSRLMAGEVARARASHREVHVIHLGDVYYCGDKGEVERHVLAPGAWPVNVNDAAAGVTSWSLNGNHDMYAGGHGYFETLLGEQRFAAQRSPDGKGTSYFRIKTGHWDIVGLDTSWSTEKLSMGQMAVLQDPQGDYVAQVAAESERKLMLLSHHQFFSVYDEKDIGDELGRKLAGPLRDGRISAWIWGHEHRCMGFAPHLNVPFARCIGHGGVPVLSHPLSDPAPSAPGTWEYRGFLDDDGDHWGRFGFAVLEFDDDQVHVRYVNDLGEVDEDHRETIA